MMASKANVLIAVMLISKADNNVIFNCFIFFLFRIQSGTKSVSLHVIPNMEVLEYLDQ